MNTRNHTVRYLLTLAATVGLIVGLRAVTPAPTPTPTPDPIVAVKAELASVNAQLSQSLQLINTLQSQRDQYSKAYLDSQAQVVLLNAQLGTVNKQLADANASLAAATAPKSTANAKP